MRNAVLVATLICLTCASVLRAQTTRPAATASQPDRAAIQEKIRRYQELHRELAGLLEKKDYTGAAETCRTILALVPRDAIARYNLACCLARLGKTDEALAELGNAIDAGFVDSAHIRADEDLVNLHQDKRFTDLLDKLVAGQKERLDKLYEKGDPIAGVRTVEGSPESGLRWRLRMSPAATKARPDRLIVWLHPSGGSMNKTVEALAPELVKRGYALLAPTAKEWAGWSNDDADKLLKGTLPDVAKIDGIDVNRPILLGYSAGGQLAILLWAQSPEKFGGMILDAAYPVMSDPAGSGRVTLMPPPKKGAVKDCPLFVLCGDQDNGARVWMMAEDVFRKAGVPLTIQYVAGQGHKWLFGPAQQEKLFDWLTDVSAGKKPGIPTSAPESATSQPSGPRRPIRIEDVY